MIVNIEAYSGNLNAIYKINSLISRQIPDCLLCALIHGSVASNEIIPYSDFDALAIIKSHVYNFSHLLKKTRMILKQTEKIMYHFDPLQHHGWFVLKENDLENYPEHFLPVAVLNKSKTIYPKTGIELNINPIFCIEKIRSNFNLLSCGIKNEIGLIKSNWNLFQLKNVFSQFMLLPALYVQVKQEKGIDKKESFALARQDFSESKWAIMDDVSEIRREWSYSLNPIQKFILTRNGKIRRICAKNLPISIPDKLRLKMTTNFLFRMKDLIDEMESILK